MAIKSFKHKGLKELFRDGTTTQISKNHFEKVLDILDALHASHSPKDMRSIFGAKKFQEKKGSGKGVYSVEVNGNWRIIYQIEDDGAILVDYLDYHGKQIKAK